MKAKKLVIVLDVIVAAILLISMIANNSVLSTQLGLRGKNLAAKTETEELSFNLIPDPEEKKVKAGETVEIVLSAKDINVGEEGLNSIVGFLGYDENVFDYVKFHAGAPKQENTKWNVELNKIKSHKLYGKFCIYTMQEGVTEDQEVATLEVKLKDDLKPQTTKIHFTNLASSDGEVEVSEEDRVVTLIIYEDEAPTPAPEPEPEVKPTPKPDETKPVQTGDTKILIAIIVAVLMVILNILTFGNKRKNKVLSTIIVLFAGIACLSATSYAKDIDTAKVISIFKQTVPKTWLQSEDYLVTADNVSRIAPLTKIEDLNGKFNKNINVDTNGKSAEDGMIGTGMKISVKNPTVKDAEGSSAYAVSVWGDTNGDGKSNQVELTTIIRNVVDSKKWELNGEKYLSADVTVDNVINKEDVNASVKYIVYEEMEIPEFDEVGKPTIEVSGEYDEESGRYTSNINVKITEKASNGKKTQYRVENSEGEVVPYTEISRSNKNDDGKIEIEFELDKDEVYLVEAYTTGVLGNRSEIPYVIINGVYNNIRKYTVEYYYKGLNDNDFVKDSSKTEIGYAEIGSQITTYKDKNKKGYELAIEKGTNGVEGLPLAIDKNEDNNVVKVYYQIKHYSITYNPNGGQWPDGINPNPTDYTVETPEITIDNPGRPGYDITGWTENDDDEPVNPKTIPEGSTGDIELTAEWEVIHYNITYKGLTDEERAALNNSTTYTIEDRVEIKNPEDRSNANFEGWTGTDLEGLSREVVIAEGSMGDREFTANWEGIPRVGYRVDYYYKGLNDQDFVKDDNATERDDADAGTQITTYPDKNKTGYKFVRTENLPLTVTAGDENVINVYYEIVEYSITYDTNNGEWPNGVNPNPETYTIETPDITVVNPEREGYTPIGWTEEGETTPENPKVIPQGTTGDITIKAEWELIEYDITYDPNGGDWENSVNPNPTSYSIESEDITVINPTREGYTFTGWTEEGETTPVNPKTIDPQNRKEDINLTAQWELIEYDITYDPNGGDWENSVNPNPTSYSIESEDITVINPTREGYTFTGWTEEGETTPVNPKTIDPQNRKEDINLTAQWEAIPYTITYNGITPEEREALRNPETYTIESADITLNNPENRTDANFLGWTGTGLSGRTQEVKIPQGSMGDRVYTANWDGMYTVEYYYKGLNDTDYVRDDSKTESEHAEIGTEITTYEDKNKAGYEFVKTENLPLTVTADGENTIKVYYKITEYSITYDTNNGEWPNGVNPNPETYTIETPDITVVNPEREGYTPAGWTEEGETTPENPKVIPQGTTGDIVLTAQWDIIEYQITYDPNGGDWPNGVNPNPETYTIETPDITVVNPEREGYTPIGWTEEGETTPENPKVIPQGTTGDITITAQWEAIPYAIIYNEITPEEREALHNPETYTIEDRVEVNNPGNRTDANFLGWTGTDEPAMTNSVIIPVGSTGDREYTANWQFLAPCTIHYREQGVDGDAGKIADDKELTNQIVGTTIQEEAIDINGFNKINPTSAEIEILAGTNEYTFYYERRTNLSYTVHYREEGVDGDDGILAPDKVVTGQRFENVVTEEAIDIDGFNKISPTSAQIEITTGVNEHTFYYSRRSDLGYTIHYREQGVDGEAGKLAPDKIETGKTFGAKITEEAIDINGYTKLSPTTKVIEITTGTNEWTFYYAKLDNLGYIVKYWDKDAGTEIETAKAVSNVEFNTQIDSTTEIIEINGYAYDSVDPATLVVGTDVTVNVINIYYTKLNNLSYTVHYREQGVDGDAGIVAPDRVVPNQTFGTTVTENAIDINGYDKVAPTSAEIEITTGVNEYTFYYTKRHDLGYIVHYREEGVEGATGQIAPDKVETGKTFGDKITEEAIDIDGFNKIPPTSTEIEITTGTNEYTFYYTRRTNLTYTVHYREIDVEGDSGIIAPDKVVTGQRFEDVVTEEAININGFNKIEPTTAQIEITTGVNEHTFYYNRKTDLTYTVHYREEGVDGDDGIVAPDRVVTGQTFGAKVTEEAIDIDGFNIIPPTSAEIEITTGVNEHTFYYSRRTNLSYTVHYREEGVDGDAGIVAPDRVVTGQRFGDLVTENAIDINGFNKIPPTSAQIEITTGVNEHTFYYSRRSDLGYTIHYREQGVEGEVGKLAPDKIETGKTFGAKITEEAIDINGYTKLSPTTKVIEITTGTNEWTFYYAKLDNLGYVVKYWDKDTSEEIETAKAVSNIEFNTQIDSTTEIIEINGYAYDSVDPTTLTVGTDVTVNVINIYYTKLNNLSYTVHYREQGVDGDAGIVAPDRVVPNQTFGTTVTENAIDINGYDKVAPTSAEIEITTGVNEYTFYYTKRHDLGYTVHYREEGVEGAAGQIAPDKIVPDQTFGDMVDEEAIDIDGFDKVEPTTAQIEITTGTNEHTFYYSRKTNLSYTIHYREIDVEGDAGIVAPDRVVTGQRFGDLVTENAIDVNGFNKIPPTSTQIEITTGTNEYTFYYARRVDLGYTVHYREQGVDGAAGQIAPDRNVSGQTFGAMVNEEAIDIDGFDKVEPTTAQIEITTGTNEHTFYYNRKADLTYTVHYREEGVDGDAGIIAPDKVVTGQRFEDVVTENAIDINGFNKIPPTSAEIEITTGVNEHTFYYSRRTDLTYTVHYREEGVDGDSGKIAPDKVVTGQRFEDVVTENAIDINGFNKIPPTSANIEITTGVNEHTFYYTRRADLTYTVHYREEGVDGDDGIIAPDRVVTNQTFGAKVTENAIDIDGFNKIPPTSAEIEITTGVNEHTFYYSRRTNLTYTVHYREEGVDGDDGILADDKVVTGQTFGDKVTEEAIDIDGFNKVEPTTAEIEITTGVNEHTFYYSRKTDLAYTIHYREQGVDGDAGKLANDKVVTGQTFGAKITEEAIDINGYTKLSPTTTQIEITTGVNEYTFYYAKLNNLGYVVRYWDKDEEVEIKTAKAVSDVEFNTQIDASTEVIDIDGYVYDSVNPAILVVGTDATVNVINVYYVKRADLTYTVHYREQGVEGDSGILAPDKVVPNQTFGTTVTENAIDINGYDKVAPTSADIEITTGVNEHTFYYTKRNDLTYTVHYREQGVEGAAGQLAEDKVVTGQTFGALVNEEAIDINGFNKVEPTTAQIEITTGTNEHTFYYTRRADLTYTVHYREQGVEGAAGQIAEDKVVTGQIFGALVNEEAIDINGFNKVEPTTAQIEITTGTNEHTFYYTRRADLTYTVHYREQGVEGAAGQIAEDKVVTGQTFGAVVNEEAIDINGFNKVEPTTAQIEITTGTNEHTFYYNRRTDLTYTIHYREQGVEGIAGKLADDKVVTGQTFGAVITENAIDINGFNKVEPISAQIEITTGTNEHTFYYTRRTDLTYTIHYREQDVEGAAGQIAEDKVVTGQTFGAVVNEEAIDIDGFNKVAPSSTQITITTGTNEYTFYYARRTDLKYTVHYREQGVEGAAGQIADDKTVTGQTFGAVVNEQAIDIDGFYKVEPTTAQITITTGTNEYTFFYTRRHDLTYTVHYREQGVDGDAGKLAEDKVVTNQTFEDIVTENAIDINGFNKIPPTSADIEITTGTNEHTFFYTRRNDLSYTVKYIDKNTSNEIHARKTVPNQTFEAQITSSTEVIDIDNYVYDSVDPETLTIGTTEANNVINVYYVKTFTITAEAVDTNGQPSGHATITGVPATVNYGADLEEAIMITTEAGYRATSFMLYKKANAEDSFDMQNGTDIGINVIHSGRRHLISGFFEDVTEFNHIVVTIEGQPIVAQVVTVPEDLEQEENAAGEQILNNVYTTIEDALADAYYLNLLAAQEGKSGNVEIKLIAEDDVITEQNTVVVGNDVILDLNGHEVLWADDYTFEVKEGAKLQVVDRSNNPDGSIVNDSGIAVTTSGEFILGDNEDDEVSITSPVIQGGTYGLYIDVVNGSGTFDFYDGRIIGNTTGTLDPPAARGGSATVRNTPLLYELHEENIDQGGVTLVLDYLGKAMGIEAVIGTTTYQHVQKAFYDVNQGVYDEAFGDEPVLITLVDDPSLDDTDCTTGEFPNYITLDEGKSAKLDMNGHILHGNVSSKFIENKGTLEITDSTADVEEIVSGTLKKYSAEDENYYVEQNNIIKSNYTGADTNTSNYGYIEFNLGNRDASEEYELLISTFGVGNLEVNTSAEKPENYTLNAANYTSDVFSIDVTGGEKYYIHLKNNNSTSGKDFFVYDVKLRNKSTGNKINLMKSLVQTKGLIYYDKTYGQWINNLATGTLKINSVAIGEETLHRTSSYRINNNGNMEINNAIVLGTVNNDVNVDKTSDISNAIILGPKSSYSPYAISYAIYHNNSGSVTAAVMNIEDSIISNQIQSYATVNMDNVYTYGVKNNLYNGADFKAHCATITDSKIGYIEYVDYNGSDVINVSDSSIGLMSYKGTVTLTRCSVAGAATNANSSYGNITLIETTVNGAVGVSTMGTVSATDSTITGATFGKFVTVDGGTYSNIIVGAQSTADGEGNIISGTTGGITLLNCTLNIGSKNDSENTEVSKSNPLIQSGSPYPITGFGKMNFYDGKIVGPTGNVIGASVVVNEIEPVDENGHELSIIVTPNGATDEYTLGISTEVYARIATTYDIDTSVVNPEIEDGYYIFHSINEAIRSCRDNVNTEIQVTQNYQARTMINVSNGKDIVLDLNGKSISGLGITGIVENNGKLVIKDSDTNGAGKITGDSNVIHNGTTGTLIVNNCKIEATGSDETYGVGSTLIAKGKSIIYNEGTATIDGFTAANNMLVKNEGTLNFVDGTLKAVANFDDGIFNMSGNGVTCSNIANINSAVFNMSNGTVNMLYNDSDATNCGLNITNGVISGNGLTNAKDAPLTITQTQGNTIDIVIANHITNPTNNTLTLNGISNVYISSSDDVIANNCEITFNRIYGKATITDSTIKGGEIQGAGSQIKGSTITGAVTINSTGNASIENTTIQGTSITNSNAGTLTLDDVTYTTSVASDRITNSGTGTIIIKDNCTITNSSGCPVVNSGKGTIQLGEEDGVVKDTPVVTGRDCGVQNSSNGTFKYYDGTIIGVNEDPSIPSGYNYEGVTLTTSSASIHEEERSEGTTNYKTLTLRRLPLAGISKASVTEQELDGYDYDVGNDYYEFPNVQAAINACPNNGTVYIIKENCNVASVEVASTKNIQLDMNGKNLSVNGFANEGTLEIINSGSTGVMTLNASDAITNSGTLTFDNINVEFTRAGDDKDNHAVAINNTGTLNLTGDFDAVNNSANVNLTAKNKFQTLILNNGGNVTVTNFNSKTDGSNYSTSSNYINFIVNSGICTINNSNIYLQNIINNGTGTCEMNASTFNGAIENNSTKNVANDSQPAVKVLNSKLNIVTTSNDASKGGITNTAGEFVIDGSNTEVRTLLTGISQPAQNKVVSIKNTTANAILRIKDGQVDAVIDNYGIYTHENATLSGGLNNYVGANATILSGEYNDDSRIKATASFTTGIKNAGTLTIGDNSNAIDSTTPYINYGNYIGSITNEISNSYGSINFYDGKIRTQYSTTYSSYPNGIGGNGEIDNIPDDTVVTYTTEPNGNKGIITYELSTENVAQIGTTEYKTIKAAVEACTTSNQTTIDLISNKNIVLTADDKIEIGQNQNIVLNLNGKTVQTSLKADDPLITVNGKFTVTDSVGDGKIVNQNGYVVDNNNELNINGGTVLGGVVVTNETAKRSVRTTTNISGGTVNFIVGTNNNSNTAVNITGNAYVKSSELKGSMKCIVNGENVVIDAMDCNCSTEIIKDKIVTDLAVRKYTSVQINGGTVGTIKSYNSTGLRVTNNSIIGKITRDSYATAYADRNLGSIYIEDSVVLAGIVSSSDVNSNKVIIGENTIINPPTSQYTRPAELSTYTQSSYGIQYGYVRIGVKDYDMKLDTVKIYGATYGLYSTRVDFYDGTVYGGSRAQYNLTTNSAETGYTVQYSTDQKTMSLQRIGDIDDRALISTGGSGTYETVQQAFNAVASASNKVATIDLINGDTEISDASGVIEVRNGMKITLKMNSKNITGALPGALIIVREGGTLTIVDEVVNNKSGKIENTAGPAIEVENGGILNLGTAIYTDNEKMLTIKGDTNAIVNNGTVKLYIGTLISKQAVVSPNNITNTISGYTLYTESRVIEGETYNAVYWKSNN